MPGPFWPLVKAAAPEVGKKAVDEVGRALRGRNPDTSPADDWTCTKVRNPEGREVELCARTRWVCGEVTDEKGLPVEVCVSSPKLSKRELRHKADQAIKHGDEAARNDLLSGYDLAARETR